MGVFNNIIRLIYHGNVDTFIKVSVLLKVLDASGGSSTDADKCAHSNWLYTAVKLE